MNNISSQVAQQRHKKYRYVFTSKEDQILQSLVSNFGTNDWELISQHLPGRTPRQCKERWTNYLSPNVIMKPWTSEEDEFLKSKLAEFGPKWVKISSFFPNRTDIQLKNRWFVLMRKEFKHISKIGSKKTQNNQEKENHNQEFSFNLNSNEYQIFNDLLENMKWEQGYQN